MEISKEAKELKRILQIASVDYDEGKRWTPEEIQLIYPYYRSKPEQFNPRLCSDIPERRHAENQLQLTQSSSNDEVRATGRKDVYNVIDTPLWERSIMSRPCVIPQHRRREEYASHSKRFSEEVSSAVRNDSLVHFGVALVELAAADPELDAIMPDLQTKEEYLGSIYGKGQVSKKR